MGKTSKHKKSITVNESNVQNKHKFKRKSAVIPPATIAEDVKEKRTKKNKSGEVENEPMNKKIIFNDDVPVEVNVEKKEATTKSEVGKQKSQVIPDDEAEVRDEDIDAFCDELDDEDNVQFDNWVKLIEEKLGPNKKK